MTGHLSDTSITALVRRSLSSEEEEEIRRHLESCLECRGRIDESCRRAGVEDYKKAFQPSDYSIVMDNVFATILSESKQVEGERATAGHLISELLHHSLEQQRILVANSVRFQSWGLAEYLLAACRASWSEEPVRAEAYAEIALDVMKQLGAGGFRARLLSDLKAEAWAYIGNCRRIRSALPEAALAFVEAESCLREGTGDHLDHARLMDLKASFLSTSGRYDEALAALDSARRSYIEASERHLEGRVLLNRAKVLYDSGRLEEAVTSLAQSRSRIDPVRDPYLELLVQWTELAYLTELGRTEEAYRRLPEVRELIRTRAPRLERLRFLWTEGLLRQRVGQIELAEEALKQVRNGFVAASIPVDVALVSLDLASLYLEDGRTAEVRQLVAEAAPLFASRGIEREVLMAWSLFCQAAERDAATIELVGRVSDRIRRAAQR